MNMQNKLLFFQELISCCQNIYFWKYDKDMNLLSHNCEHESIMNGIFIVSKCREYLLDYIKENVMPLMLSDSFGIMWIAVFEKESGEIRFIHLMGPLFVNERALPTLTGNLSEKNISLMAQRKTIEVLRSIPLIYSTDLFQYALMFHYCITGEKISISQIQHQIPSNAIGKTQNLNEPDSETHLHLGANEVEQTLQTMIIEGNLNYQPALEKAASVSFGVKMRNSDALRQAKNSIIIFIALSSRSAIKGGLSAPIAYSLCDFYTELTENCNSIPELASLSHTMYSDFVHRIHNLKNDPLQSKPVRACCDYIQMHVCDKISIQTLAKLSGYTEYYLSRKFKKETGMTINEYINHKKIDQAKLLLTTTSLTIQEISESLNYCSRSYFAEVFQTYTGMSPNEYRNG